MFGLQKKGKKKFRHTELARKYPQTGKNNCIYAKQ